MYNELIDIGIQKWSISNLNKKLYGYNNSNLVESFNSTILLARKKNFAECLDSIIIQYQKKMYLRLESLNNLTGVIENNLLIKIETLLQENSNFAINEVNKNIYYVQKLEERNIVNTINKTCTCGFLFQYGYPCVYLLVVIKNKNLILNDFINNCYFLGTIKNCYSILISPYSITYSMNNEDQIIYPDKKIGRGRPKIKRIKTIMDIKNK